MRWFSVGLLCALVGCAKLNGAFDDSKASGTGGVGSTGVETPPRTTTDDVTTDDSATTHGLGTTDDGTTTHHDETGDEGSSSTNGIKVADAGINPRENAVVFLYAAEGWRGDSSLLIPGPGAFGSAVIHCMDHVDYMDGCNTEIPALPLLRTDGLSAENITPMDWAQGFGPVYGIHAEGDVPIASSITDLLQMETIDPPLAMSGVVSGGLTAEGSFWSGGRTNAVGNCDNWSTDANNTFAGAGTLNTPPSADGDWFDVSDESCSATLPILCACLSPPDPFD